MGARSLGRGGGRNRPAALPDRPVTEVLIAVGGNLPADIAVLRADLDRAVDRLPLAGFDIQRRSRWWRSAAWPDASDPPFLNALVLAETALGPEQALDALLAIEREWGRVVGARNGPRPLDLDLVAFGDLQLDSARLTLPHPRARERLFVTGPLSEVTGPDWRWPGDGRTAAELVQAATVGLDATPEQSGLPDG